MEHGRPLEQRPSVPELDHRWQQQQQQQQQPNLNGSWQIKRKATTQPHRKAFIACGCVPRKKKHHGTTKEGKVDRGGLHCEGPDAAIWLVRSRDQSTKWHHRNSAIPDDWNDAMRWGHRFVKKKWAHFFFDWRNREMTKWRHEMNRWKFAKKLRKVYRKPEHATLPFCETKGD